MGRATGSARGSFFVSAAFLGLFALRAWGVAPDVALLQVLLCVVMLLGAFAVRAGRTGAWVALGAAAVTALGGGAVWVLSGMYVPGTIVALWAGAAAYGALSAGRPAGASTGTSARTGPVAVPGGRRFSDPAPAPAPGVAPEPLDAPWPHPAQRLPDHVAPPAPGTVPDPRRHVPAYNAAAGESDAAFSAPSGPAAGHLAPAPHPTFAPAPRQATRGTAGHHPPAGPAAAAPQFATAAARPTLSSLRTTSVSNLQTAGAVSTPSAASDGPHRFGMPPATVAGRSLSSSAVVPAGAPHSPGLPGGGDRLWGSPAAPGSATQVLPGRGGRRRWARGGAAAVPGQRAAGLVPSHVPAPAPSPAPAPAPEPAFAPASAPAPVPGPGAVTAPSLTPMSAPAEPLGRRPGDPQVGAALLAPARARLRELEAPLLTSWLAALAAGERAEPAAALSPGQIAVLAAACEDPAVSARLLDAVTDAPTHAARAARAARAAALLHTVARSTSGTDAQPAVLRTLDGVHTS